MKIKDLPKNSFFEYYRDEDGNLKGVVLALDKNLIGWSICNKLDRFDKEFGIGIAYRRAIVGSKVKMPAMIRPTYDKVVKRAEKYYK